MKRNSLLITLLLFLVFGRADAQKNLITNGGFEDDDLYGWNQNGAKQTPWAFKSGKNACAIITPNTDNWVGIDQVVKIPKKVQAVEFSAWIRATNVVKGKNDWDGAIFTIVFLDGQDKQMGDGVNIAKVTGDQDWTLFTKVIQIPAKAFSFKVLLAMGNASGSMVIDDVTAIAVSPEQVKQ
jgi:hypothetical protein